MKDVWSRVMKLNGTTLYTTRDKQPFDIVAVLSDRVKFIPKNGKGKERWLLLERIEHICSLDLKLDVICPRDIKQIWPDDQNTSYIAAIIREIAK